MEMVPEQEQKVREFQMKWKGLTNDELLDMELKVLRQPPGEHPTSHHRVLVTMAMDDEMERRGIPWETRIARQDKMISNVQRIKEMVDQIYNSEHQEEKERITKALVDNIYGCTEQVKSRQEIDELYEQESELRKSLEDEMRRRVDFTRALVHELKNPVTAMMASSQLLVEEAPEGPLLRLARNIEESVVRLNKRISELLDIARGELNILKFARKEVDMVRMLQGIVAEMRPVISSHGQSLVVELPPSISSVMGDEERLREVVLNLLSNAIKFTPNDGTVTMMAREDNENLIVEVKDTGVGLAREHIQKVFEPYYRIEPDRQQLPGLGLGLAICKRTVEQHRGKIWVRSQKGKGSTFGFSIPLNTDVD